MTTSKQWCTEGRMSESTRNKTKSLTKEQTEDKIIVIIINYDPAHQRQ